MNFLHIGCLNIFSYEAIQIVFKKVINAMLVVNESYGMSTLHLTLLSAKKHSNEMQLFFFMKLEKNQRVIE